MLGLLESLPTTSVATHEEVLTLLDAQRLFGKGLGFIDVHLLAAARLSHVMLWTRDKSLHRAAVSLTLSFKEWANKSITLLPSSVGNSLC